MPKKYGVKEKDQVVAHIFNLVLTGKRQLAFATNEEINVRARIIRLCGQTGIVTSDDDSRGWSNGLDEMSDLQSSRTLKRHDRHP